MKDAINKIKEAEEKATKIVLDASKEAQNIIKTANEKAKKLYDDNIKGKKEELVIKVEKSCDTLKNDLMEEVKSASDEAAKIVETVKKNGTEIAGKILNDLLK